MAQLLSGDAEAAIRAMRRHLLHADGQHLCVGHPDGLHKQHYSLLRKNDVGQEPVNAAGQSGADTIFLDVLDALTLLDRVDGGFSLLLRVPGLLPIKKEYEVKDMQVDAYIPPREVAEHGSELSQGIGRIVGIFTKEIATKHLKRLESRYAKSGVEVVRQSTVRVNKTMDENVLGPSLIPPPVGPGEPRYCFAGASLGKALELLERDEYGDFGFMQTRGFAEALDAIEKEAAEKDRAQKSQAHYKTGEAEVKMPVGAERASQLGQVGTHSAKPTKLGKVIPSRRGKLYPTIAESFTTITPNTTTTVFRPSLESAVPTSDSTLPTSVKPETASDPALLTGPERSSQASTIASSLHQPHAVDDLSGVHEPIISIGLETDKIIDKLKLDDRFILHLHRLSQRVRSSRWVENLEAEGLDKYGATLLADALLADLRAKANKGSKDGTRWLRTIILFMFAVSIGAILSFFLLSL